MDQPEFKLDSIEDAIRDIKKGNVVIVVDDEDRENEGDFICAAEKITPAIVNFMATVGRGLICAPILENRANELGLTLMVDNNTALYETAFTVSVDLLGSGCTTGISAYDRAMTIKALSQENFKANDFSKPGHIFPLIAKQGGVLRRTGHTEAAIDLARIAGLKPVGALVEILNEDGSMARLPELINVAKKYDLKIISIKDLVAYRMQNERLIELDNQIDVKTQSGKLKVYAFRQINTGDLHFAIVFGNIYPEEDVLVKVYSHTMITEAFRFLFEMNPTPVEKIVNRFREENAGILLFMRQREKDSLILEKIKKMESTELSSEDKDMENRDFGIGAQILTELGVRSVKLISSNPVKKIALKGYGLEIKEIVTV
ncbi:MAG: 3,4-dihydroxy-2-butanone-4-phosphate synthase [Deltaproteobacteria bacterium]